MLGFAQVLHFFSGIYLVLVVFVILEPSLAFVCVVDFHVMGEGEGSQVAVWGEAAGICFLKVCLQVSALGGCGI